MSFTFHKISTSVEKGLKGKLFIESNLHTPAGHASELCQPDAPLGTKSCVMRLGGARSCAGMPSRERGGPVSVQLFDVDGQAGARSHPAGTLGTSERRMLTHPPEWRQRDEARGARRRTGLTRLRPAGSMSRSSRQRCRLGRGIHGQEDFSAQQRPSSEEARVSRANEDRQGPPRPEAPAREGKEEIDRLTRGFNRRFGHEDRLHLRREFEAVYARGRRFASHSFILFLLPNGLGRSRLGVTVSRRVGDAVTRNRARRRLREVFRTNRGPMGMGFDIVLHARTSIAAATYAALEKEFLGGLGRIGMGARSLR